MCSPVARRSWAGDNFPWSHRRLTVLHEQHMMDTMEREGMFHYRNEAVDLEHEAELKDVGTDTESDGALEAVQALVNSISRGQGGTESAVVDASKGNVDGFDLDANERVSSDPQGFRWGEMPRMDCGYCS